MPPLYTKGELRVTDLAGLARLLPVLEHVPGARGRQPGQDRQDARFRLGSPVETAALGQELGKEWVLLFTWDAQCPVD